MNPTPTCLRQCSWEKHALDTLISAVLAVRASVHPRNAGCRQRIDQGDVARERCNPSSRRRYCRHSRVRVTIGVLNDRAKSGTMEWTKEREEKEKNEDLKPLTPPCVVLSSRSSLIIQPSEPLSPGDNFDRTNGKLTKDQIREQGTPWLRILRMPQGEGEISRRRISRDEQSNHIRRATDPFTKSRQRGLLLADAHHTAHGFLAPAPLKIRSRIAQRSQNGEA